MTEEEIESRLWALHRRLGCSRPPAGLEEVNHHVLQSACHFAVFRMDVPPQWYEPARLELAQREAKAAQQEYALSQVKLDGFDDELARIARALLEIDQ